MRKFDLEHRLVRFSVGVIRLIEKLPKAPSAVHLAGQLTRSGTAPALLYGEAQSAESRKDFIHKMKIALKELRETKVCLQLIGGAGYIETSQLDSIVTENDELIAIFHKSISTATTNLNNESHS